MFGKLRIFLFGKKKEAKKSLPASFGIEIPEDDERTFSPRVSRKGLSEKDYYRALAKNSQETFRNASIDAKNLGSKHYIWKTCGDSDVCPACSKNQGKKFLFSKAPAGGHPGAGTHCKHGHCRCYAEVVIPR